jgi:hypothetical protein
LTNSRVNSRLIELSSGLESRCKRVGIVGLL